MIHIKHITQKYSIGLLFVAVLTLLTELLGTFTVLTKMGITTLTLAIIIGMLVGNTVYPKISAATHEGVLFSKTYLLKLGIILYAFHLTVNQLSQVGMVSLLTDVTILSSTFLLTYFLGHKVLKIDQNTTFLIGSGCSICGAAAILATESVVKADTDKVAIAVSIVVIFGTLAMFFYPAMFHWGWWGFTDSQWGIYIGSSVHEVAQVYVAGDAINHQVADIAVTTKMIRVMLLAPFLIALSFWINLQSRQLPPSSNKDKISIPWFAVIFVILIGVNSLKWLPDMLVNGLLALDNIVLIMSMVALGLTTRFTDLKKAGVKPLILGACMLLWLVVGGGLLQVML